MPPKGSGQNEKGFMFNEGRTEVCCKVCAVGVPAERRTWISAHGAGRHLLSQMHLQALDSAEDARRRVERLAKEREVEAATKFCDVQSTAPRFTGPVAGLAARVMGEAEAAMWADYRENGADFSAGDTPEDNEARERQLRGEAELFGLWNPDATARRLGFGEEGGMDEVEADLEDDWLADITRIAGLQEPELTEIQDTLQDAQNNRGSDAAKQWFPYTSKIMFLLDILDNLPRLRISSPLMRVIIWMLKEGGCKDVPSFDHLRKVQKDLRKQFGIPTIPCKSVQGNVFFMNDPRSIIAQDWSNPTTRELIHVYPEIPEDGIIREIWHAQKWRKNMDLDILSPIYDAGICHYYVNEVARLQNGNFVVPVRWIKFRSKVYADAFSVALNEEGEAVVVNDKTILVCSEDLIQNYYDLEHAGELPTWAAFTAATVEAGYPARMPNPKRVIAAGRPLETHTEPVEVQDNLGNATCFSLYVNSGPSDNPMQSEISAHIGGKGNCFCCKCQVGGTQKEKATNEGYHALFELCVEEYFPKAGVPRTKEQILEELRKQDSQTATGVKDAYTQFHIDELISRFKQMRKDQPDRSVDDIEAELIQWTIDNRDRIYSPFLTLKDACRPNSGIGFDPAKDTPIELLHTILLGIVKYIWHVTHTSWSPEQKKMYAMRLQSTNTDGLSIHAIRSNYIMQYAGSLIGRQFKTIAQTNIFHIRGLVTEDHFKAWRATGELAALLWFPEIRNLAEYRRDLKIAVANVLDIFAVIDPSKIMSKIKYHLLVHTDDDVVEFGPLVGAITEIYEAFNAVFRWCSVLSNHLAPSRDIARQLADQEGLKHRLTGGRWCGTEKKWEQAGSGVVNFLVEHPILQKLVGWTEPKIANPGDIKLVSLKHGEKERAKHLLRSTTAARALNYREFPADSEWTKCRYVVSDSLDECLVESWVFTSSPFSPESIIPGRITEILVAQTGEALVVLEQFISSSRDEVYGMPVLDLRFKFNVQHDCGSAGCDTSGIRLRMQERVESDQVENYVVHNTLDRLSEGKTRDKQATQAATRAEKKRKRLEEGAEEGDDDDGGQRPGKKQKKSAKRRAPSGGRGRGTRQLVGESMVANRAKRVIRKTKTVMAAPEPDSETEDEDTSEEDENLSEYEDSD
ncbi:hypothetical protein B0H16DRAFT_1458060 [Mycena metata]|uniref:Uncharacterized protein n=1 Tax=Mycena metata TaxID=1033252 RepID=A0AAD7J887_9AGAR|nr:hypothetical protein B0H16DRAFT_1458060 [Mycena metata]